VDTDFGVSDTSHLSSVRRLSCPAWTHEPFKKCLYFLCGCAHVIVWGIGKVSVCQVFSIPCQGSRMLNYEHATIRKN